MNILTLFKTLGPVDFKNIRRDSLLGWLLSAPLFIALLFRFGLPQLNVWSNGRFQTDLTPYYPFLISFLPLFAPGLAGAVIGFLLLDERDERTLTALLVTPLPLNGYLLYRLSLPVLLGFASTLLVYPLIGLLALPWSGLFWSSLLGALTGPLITMYLATFAENKVSGLALVKILNSLSLIPMAMYFVHSPWQVLAGIMPTYWGMKVFWLAATGQSYGWYVLGGLLVNTAAIWLFQRRLRIILHR